MMLCMMQRLRECTRSMWMQRSRRDHMLLGDAAFDLLFFFFFESLELDAAAGAGFSLTSFESSSNNCRLFCKLTIDVAMTAALLFWYPPLSTMSTGMPLSLAYLNTISSLCTIPSAETSNLPNESPAKQSVPAL